MKNYDSRIAKLEEILAPKTKILIIISYESDCEQSWVEFDGKKFLIPKGAEVHEFIEEKTKAVNAKVITCKLFLCNTTHAKSIPKLTEELCKNDILMTIKGIGNSDR